MVGSTPSRQPPTVAGASPRRPGRPSPGRWLSRSDSARAHRRPPGPAGRHPRVRRPPRRRERPAWRVPLWSAAVASAAFGVVSLLHPARPRQRRNGMGLSRDCLEPGPPPHRRDEPGRSGNLRFLAGGPTPTTHGSWGDAVARLKARETRREWGVRKRWSTTPRVGTPAGFHPASGAPGGAPRPRQRRRPPARPEQARSSPILCHPPR